MKTKIYQKNFRILSHHIHFLEAPIKFLKKLPEPVKQTFFRTFLRSPHVHKKAMEHFWKQQTQLHLKNPLQTRNDIKNTFILSQLTTLWTKNVKPEIKNTIQLIFSSKFGV